MPEKDTPFDAPWLDTLRHRSDPNRVDQAQLPLARLTQTSAPSPPREVRSGQTLPLVEPTPQAEPSYYDVSMLKKPIWKWEIAGYFFLGGLSAGAYILARMAERVGGNEHRDVARVGTWISLATVIPCPPLLIADLGDPKRFHHMLRVFKPSTPMNLGTWMLVSYSGMVVAASLRELLRARGESQEDDAGAESGLERLWLLMHDTLGIPLAIGIAGYTGVLLSCTANPLWCKNPWLGPLFSASALSSGAEAISLVLDCTQKSTEELEKSQKVLQRFDTVAHAAEAVCNLGYQNYAGEKAEPLKSGSMSKVEKFATGALVASEVLKVLPVGRRYRKPVRMLAAATGLAAGFALRWAMVYGGQEAAEDPHLARMTSRSADDRPGASRRLHQDQAPPHQLREEADDVD